MARTPFIQNPLQDSPLSFFEQAEHFFYTLFPVKERYEFDELMDKVVFEHKAGAQVSRHTLGRAENLPLLKRRVRVGMLLQRETVDAIHRLSVRVR